MSIFWNGRETCGHLQGGDQYIGNSTEPCIDRFGKPAVSLSDFTSLALDFYFFLLASLAFNVQVFIVLCARHCCGC